MQQGALFYDTKSGGQGRWIKLFVNMNGCRLMMQITAEIHQCCKQINTKVYERARDMLWVLCERSYDEQSYGQSQTMTLNTAMDLAVPVERI
jgi:hypothetical protein